VILGIGSGWFEKDYDEYGYDFGTAGSRLDDLADALPRIKTRWQRLNPPPTRRIPVLIGGGGERRTLRLVAEHADIWHSFSDADTMRHKTNVLARHCGDVGRDPSEIEKSVGVRGTPAELGPALVDAGVSIFTVGISGPDYRLDSLERWIDWRNAL
jgi:alkanesulfonate monooxygenase SsuD/methylene tetrahydromethanopterin reductase-like flavin-dependent oxidoreductase (luciferase family)